MKRTLSLILAALMLASTMACGNTAGKTEPKETEKSETKAVETNAPETNPPATDAPATDAPETQAPAPSYNTSLITENGVAKAHIVLADNAHKLEKTAADELALHIKLVSGAEVSITNTAAEDSLPIIIATPDSHPELETLFPEDLAWLRVLEEAGENGRTRYWGDDGFAVRQHDGKIYIFGATAVGALNGTYDFIEENLDVIWIGQTDAGIIYDEMPTVSVLKADYREKSPFTINTPYAYSENVYRQRNKQYVTAYPYLGDATVKSLLLCSPSYDPNIDEYWDTDMNGNHLQPSGSKVWYEVVGAEESKQVNFWSQLTADTIGDGVIATLDGFSDADRPKYINVCMEDIYQPCVYPEQTLPFEYAPGQFVNPGDADYLTTVYFTFINRVARRVAQKYPEVFVNSLAYSFATGSPRCELEKNVSIWFAPFVEDYTQDSFAVALAEAEAGISNGASIEAKQLYEWIEQHPTTPIMVYNYYFCNHVQGWYERPIWYRLQNDFQFFAENGFIGTTSCGIATEGTMTVYPFQQDTESIYAFTYDDGFKMNLMSLWIYYKLMWNPYEDVDALIVEFCDKVYGDASDEMQEYYAILYKGWNYGATEILPYEFNAKIKWNISQDYYLNYFLDIETDDGVYILDALTDAITRAYEAADDQTKEFIRRPYEMFSQDWTRFVDD